MYGVQNVEVFKNFLSVVRYQSPSVLPYIVTCLLGQRSSKYNCLKYCLKTYFKDKNLQIVEVKCQI